MTWRRDPNLREIAKAIGAVVVVLAAGSFLLALIQFGWAVAVARYEPGRDIRSYGDHMVAAFIATRRLEVPPTCVPPAFEPGSEHHRRQIGEESQTTLFLCLRPTVRACERFSLFMTCWHLVWPAEVKYVPGLVDHLVAAHGEPCRVFVRISGSRLMRWRNTGYFPQDIAENEALLNDEKCHWLDDTLTMKVHPLPPRPD